MNMKYVKTSFSYLLLFLIGINILLAQSQSDKVSILLDKTSVNLTAGEKFNISLTAKIVTPWHINSNAPNDEFLIPTVISVEGKGLEIIDIKYPEVH